MHWSTHVLPHSDLFQLAPRIWQVTGRLPHGPLPRNMLIYRLPSGGLLILSAVAVNEETLAEILRLGEPEILVVPNGAHRLDAAIYKERFPRLKVVGPAAALAAIATKVKVDGNAEDILPDYDITCLQPAGIKPSELAYLMDTGLNHEGLESKALVVTDLLFNLPKLPGIGGWVLGALGSTGFFGVTSVGKWLMRADRHQLKSWLYGLSQRNDLSLICVGHGDAVTEQCGEALRAAAARLS